MSTNRLTIGVSQKIEIPSTFVSFSTFKSSPGFLYPLQTCTYLLVYENVCNYDNLEILFDCLLVVIEDNWGSSKY